MSVGRFITVEGIEGVGKTTQVQAIRDWLQSQGMEVVSTREPGGTPVAEKIRDIVLGKAGVNVPPACELLLMFAARAAHVAEVIQPALARGAWVLCDRFTDATFAYQGGGRGVSKHRIEALEDIVQDGLRPDLTLLLDAPVEVALGRAKKRSAPDRFETETVAFFNRVRDAYLDRAKRDPARIRIVDASPDVDRVRQTIIRLLEETVRGWDADVR